MMWFAVTLCSAGTNLSFRNRAMGQRSVLATSKAAILSYRQHGALLGVHDHAQNGCLTFDLE